MLRYFAESPPAPRDHRNIKLYLLVLVVVAALPLKWSHPAACFVVGVAVLTLFRSPPFRALAAGASGVVLLLEVARDPNFWRQLAAVLARMK